MADRSPGAVRKPARALSMALAGAAMLLAGCVVPVPIPGPTVERQSSMALPDARCPADAALGERFRRPVDPARPDQALLAQALRKLVNAERCRRGAAPLGLSPGATEAATGHARAMARLNFMGHRSPVQGRETLKKRLGAAKAEYRLAGENVARAAASAVPGDGCMGRGHGPAPTYGRVARKFFAMWLDSRTHRANILDQRFRALGAGIGVNPRKHRCGEVTAAMVLLG